MKRLNKPIFQQFLQKIPLKDAHICRLLRSLPRRKYIALVNQAQMKLDLREFIQQQIFLERYEPTQTEWFKECLSPGDVVVDVGANFGYYNSLAASLVGQQTAGKVFSFEPSPLATQVIEDMIETTPLKNVVLIKSAVGDTNGEITIFLPNSEYLHSPSILKSDDNFTPKNVPIIALDSFSAFKEIGHIKLIKIDVEGYEPNVITGMANLLNAGCIENIICEFNSGWLGRNASTPQELHEQIQGYGFKVKKMSKLEQHATDKAGETFELQDFWYTLESGGANN